MVLDTPPLRVVALALALALATCAPGAAAAAGDESARRQDAAARPAEAAGGELAQVGQDMHNFAASSLSDEVLRDVKALVHRFGTALQEREPRDRGLGLPPAPICLAADDACAPASQSVRVSWARAVVPTCCRLHRAGTCSCMTWVLMRALMRSKSGASPSAETHAGRDAGPRRACVGAQRLQSVLARRRR